MWMVGAYRNQKRELGPPELESQMTVSHYEGAGDKIPILWKWMSTELSLRPQVPQLNPMKTAPEVNSSVFLLSLFCPRYEGSNF